MCTWMTDIPKNTDQVEGGNKSKNYMLYLRPTEGNDVYRFRLLGFGSKTSERNTPYIQRYVHSVWVKDENGKNHTENVVCPVTPYVKKHWTEGNPMETCPICNFANQNYIAYKNSGFTDKESNKKNKEFSRKFEVLVPVYVLSDPTYPLNNNKVKVFAFYDKKDFERFLELIHEERAIKKNQVFNGVKAVDFVIQIKTVKEEKTRKNGEKYTWTYNKISRMGFMKETTAHEIPAITKELIDKFEFDEQYWHIPTKDELQEFYDKHVKCVMSDDADLPPEDDATDAIFGDGTKEVPKVEEKTEAKPQESTKTENKALVDADPVADLPFADDDAFDDVVVEKKKVDEKEDVKELPADEQETAQDKSKADEFDSFLDTI